MRSPAIFILEPFPSDMTKLACIAGIEVGHFGGEISDFFIWYWRENCCMIVPDAVFG